ALIGHGWTRSTAAVRVRLVLRDQAKGSERALAERLVGAAGMGAGRWDTTRVDLSKEVGRSLLLRLTRETVLPSGAGAFPPFADRHRGGQVHRAVPDVPLGR